MTFSVFTKFITYAITAVVFGGPASAQQAPADICFAAKDKACLEAIFEDILSEPSAEKTRAIYLLGLLEQENGDFDNAKDTFMMAVSFGGSVDAKAALDDLFEGNPNAFNEPTDCLAMQSDACFMAIIENGEGTSVRNAQYLFGKSFLQSDPARAAALLEASDAAGHGTSKCLLQRLYQTGASGVEADFHKSVSFGISCGSNHPFQAMTPDHFATYEDLPGAKAYAYADNGIATYSTGTTDPDIAARLAFEFCNASPHHQPETAGCRVINIEGTWVDGPKPPALPAFSGDAAGFILVEAQQSYLDHYINEPNPKVFVHAMNGSWTWRGQGGSGKSLEDMTTEALAQCNSHWRAMLDYPCEVVDINGVWTK